jgi:hypothetical protein
MFCKFAKDFGFPKIKKNDFKMGLCFQMKTISSCFPILQKGFRFKIKNYFQRKLLFKEK